MIRPLNVLFLLADGSHGRLVSLSRETGDYFTLVERRNGKLRRKGPPVMVFQRFGQGHDTAELGAGGAARGEADFIASLAGEAAQLAKEGGLSGIALIALPRTLAQLEHCLPPTVTVVGRLAKDLTKVRDHDLAAWRRQVRPPAEA